MSSVYGDKSISREWLKPPFCISLQRWNGARALSTVTRRPVTSRVRPDVTEEQMSHHFFAFLQPRLFRGIITPVTPTTLGRSDDVGLCDNETSLMESKKKKTAPLSWEFCRSFMRATRRVQSCARLIPAVTLIPPPSCNRARLGH